MNNESRTNYLLDLWRKPQSRNWLFKAKTSLKHLIRCEWRKSEDSADYQAWRNQFLWNRLGVCLVVAFPCFLSIAARNLYSSVFYLKEMAEIPQELKALLRIQDIAIAFLLFTCIILHKTKLGHRYPTIFFLGLSWSFTLAPQILATFKGYPFPNMFGWSLTFLTQATLMPVCWRLHLVSQLGTILYYVVVNSALGLTTIMGKPIYNLSFFLYLFWFCFICDLAIYLYERLQKVEFESRRELRVFLHAISHDLRNPVLGTSIVLQNLLKKSETQVTLNRSVLERLLQGNSRQLNLINSLLEAHTCEIQGIILHCEPLQLTTLINSVLADLEPVLISSQITVKNQVKADLPLINADITQLWRVFNNLITNALKHNPPGLTLILDAVVEHQGIRCSVQDNGVGMSQKNCERVFELYGRGEKARFIPGLGLGLYLCRQIIIAHGGKIGVISQPGVGSTFWFTLPLNQF